MQTATTRPNGERRYVYYRCSESYKGRANPLCENKRSLPAEEREEPA